jgi:CO/xanthine dehydrogenase FAD-binding subunit
MLPEFDLLRPHSLPEALAVLAEKAADVLPLAGGTNVIVDLRSGQHHPKALMNLGQLAELRGIRQDNGHIVIGGCTTIAELLADPLIAQGSPALREAAAVFANPLVRNRATVGGNLADASPAADTAPPLLTLEAEVQLVSQGASRWVRLEDFLLGVRKTLRQPHELLAAIRWPRPSSQAAGAFYKVGLRRADAISVLSAAIMVERDGAGRCAQVRIALGAVAPRPIRPHEAEEALRGQVLEPGVIAQAARLAAEASRPIDDIRATAVYRKRVTEVAVRRLLTQIANSPPTTWGAVRSARNSG